MKTKKEKTMKNKALFALTFIILTLASLPVLAGTYWVSNNGTASWAACQSATPLSGTACCDITTANINAMAGDTVYIRGGTYTGDIFIRPVNSGTSWSNQITFSAYNNETVTVTNQKVPNRHHESGPWSAVNSAVVEHSTEQKWDGDYSTRFTVDAAGEGIRSESFLLKRGEYILNTMVYSNQRKVNVYIGTDSRQLINQDMEFEDLDTPNKWVRVKVEFSVTGSDAENAYIAFRSPAGVNSGIWYVDDVRINGRQLPVFLDNKDYIKVHGIDFKECGGGFCLQNGADNNEISSCRFSDIEITNYWASTIMAGSATKQPSTHNWVHHCSFSDTGYVLWIYVNKTGALYSCNGRGCPLFIGSDEYHDASSYNLIENCTLSHGGHDNMIIETKYNTIRNNVLHNEGWAANNYSDRGGCQDDHQEHNNPALFGNRDILFQNDYENGGFNLLEGNRIGYAGTPADHDSASGIENPTDGSIIRYNHIYGNGTNGYIFKTQNGVADNNRIYNNTIYKNGGGEYIDPIKQTGIRYESPSIGLPLPSGNVIVNNIVYNNISTNGKQIRGREDILAVNTYTNNLETDPGFVNPDMSDKTSLTLPDLSLRSDSGAIDKGLSLATVAASDSGTGMSLIITDVSYFQDGTWAPAGKINADWIAVGTVTNTVQISSINYAANTITLANPISRNDGDNVWLYKNSSGQIVLSGSAPDIGAYEYIPSASQTVNLLSGWNWISFNVLPADLSLNSVFNGIIPQVEQVKTQIMSAIRNSGVWKGNMANMNGIGQYKMFKVKVSAACTLTVTGTAVLSATPIQLAGGWNWVAFLPITAMPIATALDSIKGQVLEVKSLTQSAIYNGTSWSGSLTQLEPGQGYAIKMSGPGTLTYPEGK
jgi:hypothetical protein